MGPSGDAFVIALDRIDCRSYLDSEKTAAIAGEVECHVTWPNRLWEDFINQEYGQVGGYSNCYQ